MRPKNVSAEDWYNYQWQLRNSIRTADDVRKHFLAFPDHQLEAIRGYERNYRFQLTPYLLSTLGIDTIGNPDMSDPLTGLFFPEPKVLLAQSDGSYKPDMMNWEMPEEMVIPGSAAFHWKYTDRLLYRSTGCMSICSYCFEAHRVIDKGTTKKPHKTDWELGMEFLKLHPEIREFVFSGGDPLLASDEVIERQLADLRGLPQIETIRFNSAVMMHCPMRITKRLIQIFKQYNVTEVGIHIVHPRQITEDVISALDMFDSSGYGSMLKLAQIPLLHGVNDDTTTMRELLCKLEQCRVKAYYVLHGMPWTLGAVRYRTPVWRGIEVLKPLYRHLSHVAWPEYIIVARGGKATVPFERNYFWLWKSRLNHNVWAIDGADQPLEQFASRREEELYQFTGTPEFIYARYQGKPVIIFRNWKGRWEMYLDSEE